MVFFEKNGDFCCEATELMAERFDLLFCFRCGFSRKALVGCGFHEELVNDEVFDNRCVTLAMLKKFRSKLFAMQFTVKQLKSSNLFKDHELLAWFHEYYHETAGNIQRKTMGYRLSEYNTSLPSLIFRSSRCTVSMTDLHSSNKKIMSEFLSSDTDESDSSVFVRSLLKSKPKNKNIISLSIIMTP